MTVTILSLAARGEDEIAVTFALREGEHQQTEAFTVSAADVADLRLCRGDSDRETFDAVGHLAELRRARKQGLYLLGYGACSRRMLCEKLRRKGFPKEIAEEAVALLCRDGYLNPAADALREAQRGVAKLWGKRRIAAALFSKGYDEAEIQDALFSLEDEGVDYAELCAERIRQTMPDLSADPAMKRKQIASLERCGFTHSEIREAFKQVSEES